MTKQRLQIPRGTRDQVLSEYSHRCAKCGGDRPQLHHIDEDPSNNDLWNLIPLCPNCHLTDQHHPTRHLEAGLLRLFRRYKDPAILAPQFYPLYRRMRFLDVVDISEEASDSLAAAAEELIKMVRVLVMGSFYGDELAKLIARPPNPMVWVLDDGHDERWEAENRRRSREYRERLVNLRDDAKSLVVEQLRFQNWSAEGDGR